MNRNKLLNLYSQNRNIVSGFKSAIEPSNNSNIIYLYDYVAGSEAEAQYWGGISAENISKQLSGMTGDVFLRIDSPGGDVFGGRAMAQAIREYDGTVIAQIDGVAASAASFIAIACDKVVMAPGSFIMIHKAWTFALGNSSDLRKDADLLDKIDVSIATSYAAKAGDDKDWMSAMAAETWYSADEAVAIGLADEALSETKAQAAITWDLRAYDKAPDFNQKPNQDIDNNKEIQEIEARKRRLFVDLINIAA